MLLRIISIVLIIFSLFYIGCKDNPSESADPNADIPANPENVTVPSTTVNNIQPSASFSLTSGNSSRVLMNLLGLVNPTTGNPIELEADYEDGNYNIYVEEDGTLKGIKLTKVSSSNVLKADVVFTVDNSGSMGQESDSIAYGIVAFANFLTASGLDAKFGCVGYDGRVYGAINLTTAENLEDYLVNRTTTWGDTVSGTNRTNGFSGTDSTLLADVSYNWAYGIWGENGVVAVLYADTMFNWRSGAQRVFVNFTDEPTQSRTSPYPLWNTAYMCNKLQNSASVHTVFSQDSTYWSYSATNERPWEMSKCTGGTVLFVPSNASGLNLSELPVAGALSNSYKVEYLTSSPTDSHTVIITVKVSDADGQKVYNVKYGQ